MLHRLKLTRAVSISNWARQCGPLMGRPRWQTTHWIFRKDKKGEFRWRCFSKANGKQVVKATEAFSSPANAKNNARMNGYTG